MDVSKNVIFFYIVFSLFSFFGLIFADVDSRKTPPPEAGGGGAAASAPLDPQVNQYTSPFRPSIAVVVGILTTVFSVTFLLLLYAKHCKRGGEYRGHPSSRAGAPTRNSGIDRAVIESLPVFRFSSLRGGQKDGLECAVCLNRFEPPEVLRLLPKCKHAFHVECVDTWLDAHSTCPLCRYRVDPEDILLIGDNHNHVVSPSPPPLSDGFDVERGGGRSAAENESVLRRVSGRHSWAGEKGTGLRLPGAASYRRSLDGRGKRSESVSVGCLDRYNRKDGLLLDNDGLAAPACHAEADAARFEHRIIVSACGGGSCGVPHPQQRWSDLHPSDLLYLRSGMVAGSRPTRNLRLKRGDATTEEAAEEDFGNSGRNVINSRSMSEITAANRFSDKEGYKNNNNNANNGNSHSHHDGERQAGMVSRWVAWVSSLSQPAAPPRCDRTVTVA